MNPIVANSHFYSFERKKSHKSFEKVEKRDEMEIKESKLIWPSRDIYTEIRWVFKSSVLYGYRQKQICNATRKVHIFLCDFWKNISHKSFEKVEKRGKMEIKESSKLIWSYKILSCVQKYVDFSNPVNIRPVYFMVLAKNRPAMLPEKQIFSWRDIFQEESFLYLSNLFLKFFKWQQLISFHGIFNYFLFL